MLYAILAYHAEEHVASWTPEEDAALMCELNKVHDRLQQEGHLGPAARLGATTGAAVLRGRGAEAVTDGPFAESKEVVGGFAIFELKSREEAIESATHFMELHKLHWPGWDGETEIRQIFGPEEFCLNELSASERVDATA